MQGSACNRTATAVFCFYRPFRNTLLLHGLKQRIGFLPKIGEL